MILNLKKKQLRNTVLIKREDTQPVFSFKIRSAYNKMAHLSPKQLSNGVVACSAGNHAQGVALSAKMLQCSAVIVMPLATPSIKVNSVRQHGGKTVKVRLFGNNYDEAASEAKRLSVEDGMTMIHPFDDPYVIAGQGTIGKFFEVDFLVIFGVGICTLYYIYMNEEMEKVQCLSLLFLLLYISYLRVIQRC